MKLSGGQEGGRNSVILVLPKVTYEEESESDSESSSTVQTINLPCIPVQISPLPGRCISTHLEINHSMQRNEPEQSLLDGLKPTVLPKLPKDIWAVMFKNMAANK